MKSGPVNLAASIHGRLLNQARATGRTGSQLTSVAERPVGEARTGARWGGPDGAVGRDGARGCDGGRDG